MDAVVVSYNAERHLSVLAADSVFRAAFDRVVVVDNASQDASGERAVAAGFDLIALERNLGFATAANIGATRVSGAYFVVMNPDVRLTDVGTTARLRGQLEHPSVALVGPALVLPDGQLQDSARRVPSPSDLVVRRFLGGHPDGISDTEPVDVDWVVGGCVAIKRHAFESLGGFDERFFLYFEDVDLGVRARQAGFRVRYDPTIRVKHDHQGMSRGPLTSSAARHHMVSALRFYARHPSYLTPRCLRRLTPGKF